MTGHGSFVVPVKQKARVLSLALQEAEIVEDCIPNQGIRLNVRAVAAFKPFGSTKRHVRGLAPDARLSFPRTKRGVANDADDAPLSLRVTTPPHRQ